MTKKEFDAETKCALELPVTEDARRAYRATRMLTWPFDYLEAREFSRSVFRDRATLAPGSAFRVLAAERRAARQPLLFP
jgi:hypothetical protein